MSNTSVPDDALPLAAKQRIDGLCVAFEEAWIAGHDPRPEEYFQEGAAIGAGSALAGASPPRSEACQRDA